MLFHHQISMGSPRKYPTLQILFTVFAVIALLSLLCPLNFKLCYKHTPKSFWRNPWRAGWGGDGQISFDRESSSNCRTYSCCSFAPFTSHAMTILDDHTLPMFTCVLQCHSNPAPPPAGPAPPPRPRSPTADSVPALAIQAGHMEGRKEGLVSTSFLCCHLCPAPLFLQLRSLSFSCDSYYWFPFQQACCLAKS